MSDDETTFVFHKSKYFFPYMNKGFDIVNLNNDYSEEGNYELILCSNIPLGGVYNCINPVNGCLDKTVEGFVELPISDEYVNVDTGEQPYFNLKCNPINDYEGGFVIGLDSGSTDIQIRIGDETQHLRAIFLVKRSNNFVMAYSTIPQPIPVKNLLTLPFDSKLIGVGYCSTQL